LVVKGTFTFLAQNWQYICQPYQPWHGYLG
jgi:hypothetical protein